MRPNQVLKLFSLFGILLVCGCESHNRGKIEATNWTSLAATVKGQPLSPGFVQLRFGGNGQMVYVIGGKDNVPAQTFRGNYTLGMGDMVIMNFDQELAGRKSHAETIKIEGSHLTMIDSDGTTITFTKN